jgi:PKD repeat protein
VEISSSPASGYAPLYVSFASWASDPDGYIASYSWNFGDGNTSTLVNPDNTYRSAGTYTARLTVTDNAGATATASVQITVAGSTPANQPPRVEISASPTSGYAPLYVSFASWASDPDGYIASYSWNFGDGNTSTQPNPGNTYQSAGTYTARLTVTDNAGATATASVQIIVNAPAPPPTTATQLRVMSWNISFGKGTDNIQNYDRSANWLAGLNADLIGLCEMPQHDVATLVSLLSQKTGRTWYSHFVPKYSGTTEGNLILSKYAFTSVGALYMSYQRSVAQATVNVGGKNINFFATHLDDGSSSVRYAQVGELTSWASNFAEPRIVVGDFNGGPDTSEAVRMTGSYFDTWSQAMGAGTATAYPDNPVGIHTRTRRGRIDYVFYSRGASNVVTRGTRIPDSRDLSNTNVVVALGTLDDRGVRPSDHNHMIADLEIR